MNCIKCGKEIPANQVFCDECLEDMERHPVKPGTPVLLPPRSRQASSKRSSYRRTMKPEEQVSALRKVIIWLLVLIVTLIIAFALSVAALLKVMDGEEFSLIASHSDSTATITLADHSNI